VTGRERLATRSGTAEGGCPHMSCAAPRRIALAADELPGGGFFALDAAHLIYAETGEGFFEQGGGDGEAAAVGPHVFVFVEGAV
jgi:hypothetical protein